MPAGLRAMAIALVIVVAPSLASAGGSVVPNPDLVEDPTTLSSPRVIEPLFSCALAVRVGGFIPRAEITVFIDGLPGGTATGLEDLAGGVLVPLAALLKPGEVVMAIQTFDGVETHRLRWRSEHTPTSCR